jgi:hypothetical protein
MNPGEKKPWFVALAAHAQKALKRISPPDRTRIANAIEEMRQDHDDPTPNLDNVLILAKSSGALFLPGDKQHQAEDHDGDEREHDVERDPAHNG